jgi:polysaccharide pyruvyl transferase WcaK-like protein
MKNISVFDTTISNYNLGNQIIMESVYKHLMNIFPFYFFFKLPSMEIDAHTIKYIKESDFVFFGGTNSLTSRMEKYKQWGISLKNYREIRNVILIGMGWWQYQTEKTSLYTKFLLKHVLSKKFIHSVRDSYTETKLKAVGFDNVINTGCPTLWGLTADHCKNINQSKSEEVILTFTDYNHNVERDKIIFETVRNNYSKIYIWLQGKGDYDYIIKNVSNKIKLINPRVASYNKILASQKVDYVGTRLHAGIRALQYGKRSIIIGIDNRGIEMAKDFNIPLLSADKIHGLDAMINSKFETIINLPSDNIKLWKDQFKNITNNIKVM